MSAAILNVLLCHKLIQFSRQIQVNIQYILARTKDLQAADDLTSYHWGRFQKKIPFIARFIDHEGILVENFNCLRFGS